jgi:hypothetical protein
MPGDRARVSYDPSRKWRGVIAQQGRVTVEADWNEAAAIDAERDRRLTLDAVGTAGSPDRGYVVTAVPAAGGPSGSTPGDLTIGPGTLYLGGERLELDAPVTYSAQPDWLDYSTDPLWVPPAVPTATEVSYELVYLLAAEEEVSAVEDPALADVALGGPDTMQRQRILQRFVRWPSPSGTCYGSWSALVSSLGGAGLRLDAASMMIESTTTLQVSFPDPGQPGPCQPTAPGGYLGAENQMIRVMVTSVDAGVPTIVWGFDDASFVYRIQTAAYDSVSGDTVLSLASEPVDSFRFPAAGQAVELLRDAVRLTATDYIAAPAGFVSALTAGYAPTSMSLQISGEPPGDYLSAATPQLYLRVWQGTAAAPSGQATPLGNTGAAVTLTSSNGSFHVGDFWRFALRPIQPTIVYPARYLTAPQPPDGPRTWACPLAVLTWEGGSATALGCVPPFISLVQSAAAQADCCTVEVRPSDVEDGATLPALLSSYANQGPLTVCLEPGTYTLPVPLVLGPGFDGLTLQACREGVILQAPSQPGAEFVGGLIAIQGATSVTIRGLGLSAPLAGFRPVPARFPDLSGQNQTLVNEFCSGLAVAIGISTPGTSALTIEDCTFSFPDPGQANVFAAGIFATGVVDGVEITGCTFQSVSPPAAVPFNDLAVGNHAASPYQLTFGYLHVPGAGAANTATQLDDATIEESLFQGVTIPALVMAQLSALRVDRNTVRNSYGGFWLVSLAGPAQLLVFDQFSVGDPQLYRQFASTGIAALRDGIFVIANAIGWVLPAAIEADFGTPVRAAPATADPGPSGPLRLDLCDCQVDAIITGSYSGAGLVVVDLTNDAGSILLHGNRIRSNFPMGETALVGGLTEAAITGNAVANEVTSQVNFAGAALTSYSMVLNPAATPLRTALNPVVTPPGEPAVAITGNVFLAPTMLPGRPATIPSPLNDWDVLNTVLNTVLAILPAVTGVSPAIGTASGGTLVTVTGSGFTGATAVAFGGRPGTVPHVAQDTQLTVTSPAGSGTVDVTVTTPGGTSPATSADQFTYLDVTGVSPNTGPAAGGTLVTVTGSGFTGATAVAFGGRPGTAPLIAQDGTGLTVTSPAGSGTVDVTVTTPAGTSPAVAADQFTYQRLLQLFCLHQGSSSNGQLWYTGVTAGSSSFRPDQQVPNVGMSDGPAAAVFNNRLYCFHQGDSNNGQLWYTSTADGTNWATDQHVANVGISAGPALAVW